MTGRTAVSLFAGVEGIGLALEAAGFDVVAAVEIDKAARGVIHDRRPQTTLFTDVTKVTAHELLAAGFTPRAGVVSAGFPCQDLSVAGRRKGMGQGTRSGLFWHIVRLLADLRPAWVLLENVPGLLSAVCPCPGDGVCGDDCPGELHQFPGGACGPGRCMVEHGGAMGAVLGALGDLGYGFAYRVLDAQHFGVPQRRRRVIVVGCLGHDLRPVEVLLEPEGGSGDPATGHEAGSRVAATLTSGSHRPGVAAPRPRQEDDTNLVVATTLTAPESKGPDSDATTTSIVSALTANGVGTCGADDNQAQAGHLVVSVAENQRGELVTSGFTQALSTGGGKPGQGYPLIMSITGDRTHTLTSEGSDASEDGSGRGTPIIAFDPVAFHLTQDPISSDTVVPAMGAKSTGNGVMTDAAVRRLTPLECERLQGFPDRWTATSWGKPQADSARYRQMGNAVAVPCLTWVTKRMAAAWADHAMEASA